jgi:hypothetical protein
MWELCVTVQSFPLHFLSMSSLKRISTVFVCTLTNPNINQFYINQSCINRFYIDQLVMSGLSGPFYHEAVHGGTGIIGYELCDGYAGDQQCPFYFTDEETQVLWRADLPRYLVCVASLPKALS